MFAPGSPALGAQNLSHWTMREVPRLRDFKMLERLGTFGFQRWGGFHDDKDEDGLHEEEVLIS